MSWSGRRGDERDGRRGYHHGNLREALIRAALDLIAQKGPAGFTFADAARSAGVSSAAPYRHFRDREALLADVARRWRPAADRSFEVLRRASEMLCARMPQEKRPPALMMSLHIWAFSHGV